MIIIYFTKYFNKYLQIKPFYIKINYVLILMRERNLLMKNKSNIVFLLVLISGLIIGSFLGTLASNAPQWLSWLNYGKTIGLTSPFVLDLDFLYFQFGFHINFTIAGIIGMLIAGIIYRKFF